MEMTTAILKIYNDIINLGNINDLENISKFANFCIREKTKNNSDAYSSYRNLILNFKNINYN